MVYAGRSERLVNGHPAHFIVGMDYKGDTWDFPVEDGFRPLPESVRLGTLLTLHVSAAE